MRPFDSFVAVLDELVDRLEMEPALWCLSLAEVSHREHESLCEDKDGDGDGDGDGRIGDSRDSLWSLKALLHLVATCFVRSNPHDNAALNAPASI